MDQKPIANILQAAKTGELVPRRDADGNWTFARPATPPPSPSPARATSSDQAAS